MGDTIQELVTEAGRLGEEDCLHSEKGHLVAARVWRNVGQLAGGLVVVLGAVIGAAVLSEWSVSGGTLGTLAIIIAVISTLTTFINPQARAQTHHARGNDYSALRGKLRRFATIRCNSGEPETKLADMLEALAGERHRLNQQGPPVPTWAYRLAKRGIKRGEAAYAVDETKPGSS